MEVIYQLMFKVMQLISLNNSLNCLIANMEYQKSWTAENDQQLRFLILDQHQYCWMTLASYFSSTVQAVKARWQEIIYPTLRSNKKIAGAFLWTIQEDKIVQYAGPMTNNKIQNLLEFLPGRTHYSLEARWKRIHDKKRLNQEKLQENTALRDLIRENHQKRLEEFRNILKNRERLRQESESEYSKIVETGDNSIGKTYDEQFV